MTARSRFLAVANSPQQSPNQQQTPSSTNSPPGAQTLDSDFVVILAALLCALICVLGLVAVARCAWIRRLAGRSSSGQGDSSAAGTPRGAANKGVKKKVLKSLPKQKYGEDEEQSEKFTECAICLAEFTTGEEIRILPQCGHGFHVPCIDTWLASHSSCPSCRQILVAGRCQKCVARCQKCGGLPESASSPTLHGGPQPEPRENHVDRFLP